MSAALSASIAGVMTVEFGSYAAFGSLGSMKFAAVNGTRFPAFVV